MKGSRAGVAMASRPPERIDRAEIADGSRRADGIEEFEVFGQQALEMEIDCIGVEGGAVVEFHAFA